MKRKDSLFELIKSLSPSEKRYFKIYAARHSPGKKYNYLGLFDAINKQSEYNESRLLKTLPEMSGSTYLPVAKNHLYKLILRSLRVFHAEKSYHSRIYEQLDILHILKEKGLFEQCRNLLPSVKQVAYKHDSHLILVFLQEFERRLIQLETPNQSAEPTLTLFAESQRQLELQSNLLRYAELSFKFRRFQNTVGSPRTAEHVQTVHNFLRDPLLQEESLVRTKRMLAYYYGLLCNCHRALGNHEKARIYARKQLDERERQRASSAASEVRDYIAAINNYAISCNMQYRSNEIRECISKLESITTESTAIRLIITERILLFKTLIITDTVDKDALPALIGEIEKFLTTEYKRIHAAYREVLMFQLAYLYFLICKFASAIEWLNAIIAIGKPARPDHGCVARVMLILAHFEAGNTDILDSQIRSCYRFLRKQNRLFTTEQIILDHARTLNRAGAALRDASLFTDLIEDFRERHAGGDSNEHFLDYFGYDVWLEAHARQIPFLDALSEKRRNSEK